jgi:hypothetical protein
VAKNAIKSLFVIGELYDKHLFDKKDQSKRSYPNSGSSYVIGKIYLENQVRRGLSAGNALPVAKKYRKAPAR